jgi:hypothetical protein
METDTLFGELAPDSGLFLLSAKFFWPGHDHRFALNCRKMEWNSAGKPGISLDDSLKQNDRLVQHGWREGHSEDTLDVGVVHLCRAGEWRRIPPGIRAVVRWAVCKFRGGDPRLLPQELRCSRGIRP